MEERVEHNNETVISVKVYGMDVLGKPFIDKARVLSINPGGMHLAGLKAQNRVGEVIGIQYDGTKVRATVVWVGYGGGSMDGHIGVQILDQDAAIWRGGQPMLQRLAANKATLPIGDRRGTKRYACHGSVSLQRPGVGHSAWSSISDVSLTGCYIVTTAPAPRSTPLEMILEVEGHTIHAKGEVRCAYPGLGMGVTFTRVSGRDSRELEALLKKLAARQNLRFPG
jgi:hypothetical protein